ncbi:hypothetical protein LCGC14_0050160 [marine sediment metagenome]|uniref:Uncharacterized protein n=1 Tax=marine sediment metagenome TaxID=412755 RepID=A0A0F9W7T0_9ZZZZ
MSIETIGTGIKATILATIATGLRVYATNEIPDTLELPCVIIMLGPGKYATAYDQSFDQVFRLILCVSKQDSPEAFNRLLDYVNETGAKSLFAALDADRTLNATASASKLVFNIQIADVIFIANDVIFGPKATAARN